MESVRKLLGIYFVVAELYFPLFLFLIGLWLSIHIFCLFPRVTTAGTAWFSLIKIKHVLILFPLMVRTTFIQVLLIPYSVQNVLLVRLIDLVRILFEFDTLVEFLHHFHERTHHRLVLLIFIVLIAPNITRRTLLPLLGHDFSKNTPFLLRGSVAV